MAQSRTKTGSARNTSLTLAKGDARPAPRGENDEAVAVEVGTDPAPTMKTTISGNIVIGSDPNKVTLPVNASLPPPPGPSGYVFYLVNEPAATTKINVGEFINWAVAQLGGSTITLPDSLREFTVAIKTLNFDTAGDFDITVAVGTQPSGGGEWKPEWKPISGLPLALEMVTLEFKKGTVPPKPAS